MMPDKQDQKIQFIPLEEKHIPLLRRWLKEPHVAEFWQEAEDETEFREKFLRKLQERAVSPFIIEVDGEEIGFIQKYEACRVGEGWWENEREGVFGIDQFIGIPHLVGRGLGTMVIREFVREIFRKNSAVEIITDPDPKNLRAIRAYEKVGFKSSSEILTPGGKALLLRLSRADLVKRRLERFNKSGGSIREINPKSKAELELVVSRMRQTLVDVLGEEKGSSLYSLEWLRDRVLWHLDAKSTTAKIFLSQDLSGHITGQAIARIEFSDAGERFGYFSTLYVEPKFRRGGIANAFLIQVENWFLEMKMPKIVYNTSDSNAKLIDLFLEHGYRITITESGMVQLTKPTAGSDKMRN